MGCLRLQRTQLRQPILRPCADFHDPIPPSPRMYALFVRHWRTCTTVALAGAVGNFAWCGHASMIPLSLAFPPLALIQSRRAAAYAVAFAYYAGASWPLIPGTHVFFGAYAPAVLAILLWLASSVILAVPWALAWNRSRTSRLWSGPLALITSAVPPIGIIGWASPLTSAGVLFPGTK